MAQLYRDIAVSIANTLSRSSSGQAEDAQRSSSSSGWFSNSTNHPLAEVRTDRAMGNLALLSVLPGYEGPAVIVESSNNSANVTEWVEDPEEVVVEEDEDDLAWLRFMDPEAINPVLYNMVRDAYRDGDYDEGPRRGYRERMAANTQGQRQGQVQRAGQRQGDGEGEIARRPVITRQPSVTEHITSIVPDYLQCAVCMSVFNQPHQDRCGHVFCLGCLQGMLQDRRTENCCPVCRGDMSEDSLYPNLLCKNLIGQLSTRCPARGEYNGRKCDWQGLIDNLSEHQKSCELHQQATCKRGGGTTEYNGDTDNNKNNNNTNDASSSSSPSSSWQVMNVDIVGKEAELVRIPEHMLQYDARKDVRGGVSGKEFVANLGKGGPQGYNKWFAGPLETEAEVLVHLHYPQRVHHYRISSASDHTHMHRNPISWEVWGLQEEKDDKAENWVMMHSVNTNHNHSKSRLSAGSSSGSSSSDSGSDSISPQFTQPLEWKNYNLDNPTNEYWKCIKLVITGNQGPEAGIQLGNFWLYMLPPFEGAIFAMPENSHYFYGNGRGEDEGGGYDSDGMEDFLGSDMSDY